MHAGSQLGAPQSRIPAWSIRHPRDSLQAESFRPNYRPSCSLTLFEGQGDPPLLRVRRGGPESKQQSTLEQLRMSPQLALLPHPNESWKHVLRTNRSPSNNKCPMWVRSHATLTRQVMSPNLSDSLPLAPRSRAACSPNERHRGLQSPSGYPSWNGVQRETQSKEERICKSPNILARHPCVAHWRCGVVGSRHEGRVELDAWLSSPK